MLSKLNTSNNWDLELAKVEFSMNNTHHAALGDAPSKILFGVYQNGNIPDELRKLVELNNDNRDLEVLRAKAIEKTAMAQNYNKQYYDSRHKCVTEYAIGDLVVITNKDTTPGVSHKLNKKFRGPYMIKKLLPNNRFVVGDIPGYQVSRNPYEGIASPDNMKHYDQLPM
uniref:Uncharacterized protein n=2 Tax=Lygus hesperus TaxID=30085 RepID=A0A0K8TD05_LYGHE